MDIARFEGTLLSKIWKYALREHSLRWNWLGYSCIHLWGKHWKTLLMVGHWQVGVYERQKVALENEIATLRAENGQLCRDLCEKENLILNKVLGTEETKKAFEMLNRKQQSQVCVIYICTCLRFRWCDGFWKLSTVTSGWPRISKDLQNMGFAELIAFIL